MLEIKKYSGNNLAEGAKIARTARLFVSGWQMNKDYRTFETSQYLKGTDSQIVIAFKEGLAIGAAVRKGKHVQAFVRKSERRNGIGSMLVSAIKSEKSYGDTGLKNNQSKKFWDHNQVRYIGY